MSGLTIEEAQEHVEALKECREMEEEIDYYKTEIALALQEREAAYDKKWEDYQRYLSEWEQNAEEEAENERQLKLNQPYGADSNYDFWEDYDEREDYNSKSEEEVIEYSCDEDVDEEEADADARERVDNVVTYQLLQKMFDYKNAEPEYCCENDEEEESRLDQLQEKLDRVENAVYQLLGGLFNDKTQSNLLDFHLRTLLGKPYTNPQLDDDELLKESIWPTTQQGYQNEEEIRLLKDQVELLRQQVSKLEETNTLLIRAIKEQIGIKF